MLKTQWDAIGLMSGTSLDGTDICHVRFFYKNGQWRFSILKANTLPYTNPWATRLTFDPDLSAAALLRLDHDYGRYLGELVQTFIKENKLNPQLIDLISSHGHTLYHQPKEGFTCQVGNGPEIFATTAIKTICNYRVQDVALGGQGAPLVPIGDEMLFEQYAACLNLGGFANVSYRQDGLRKAYDIGPVNFVLNHLAQRMGKAYDADGALARSGLLDENLLGQLDQLEHYHSAPPKSLGAEWAHQQVMPLLASGNTDSLMRTFTEHAAHQISANLNQLKVPNVLATGGGVYNSFLMERIQALSTRKIEIPDPLTIDFKEALIFAFMGVLKASGATNILASVTGARRDHSAGVVYQ